MVARFYQCASTDPLKRPTFKTISRQMAGISRSQKLQDQERLEGILHEPRPEADDQIRVRFSSPAITLNSSGKSPRSTSSPSPLSRSPAVDSPIADPVNPNRTDVTPTKERPPQQLIVPEKTDKKSPRRFFSERKMKDRAVSAEFDVYKEKDYKEKDKEREKDKEKEREKDKEKEKDKLRLSDKEKEKDTVKDKEKEEKKEERNDDRPKKDRKWRHSLERVTGVVDFKASKTSSEKVNFRTSQGEKSDKDRIEKEKEKEKEKDKEKDKDKVNLKTSAGEKPEKIIKVDMDEELKRDRIKATHFSTTSHNLKDQYRRQRTKSEGSSSEGSHSRGRASSEPRKYTSNPQLNTSNGVSLNQNQ